MKKWVLALVLMFFTLNVTQSAPIDLFEHSEYHCLAKNIYYEARGEGHLGMLAVGQVTLNRANNPNFPNSICGVVYEKGQFSWVGKNKTQPKGPMFNAAQKAAMDVLNGEHPLKDFDALHFHNSGVQPAWARNKRKLKVIRNHHFYK
jgi:N-acetylmuramoyl-L-alanine amidase